jgi:hypothetical protein
MYVTLEPGDKLTIQFHQTDGEIIVQYDHKNDNTLTVEADLPDDTGRNGVIYKESFGSNLDPDLIHMEDE